jgi:hypothetical protein
MPLSAAEAVLDPDRLRGWPAADRARLRVLLAGHAFAAGLGVWDLQELGRAVPAIGEALGSEDGDELGRLLLLWSLREQKPWQKCGPAASAFDLARYPALGGEYLRGRPDLLLFQPTAEDLPEEGPPAPILVCGAGIVFREAVLTRPGPVKVTARPLIQGGGFELHVGGQRLAFRSDPTELARRLERWARYLYGEFQPKVDAMLSVRNPALLRRLLEQRSLGCPECGRRLVGRRGEVGWPLRERSAEKAVR